MEKTKSYQNRQLANFIRWRPTLIICTTAFIFFSLLTLAWAGYGGRLNNAHIAYFAVSLPAATFGILWITITLFKNYSRKESILEELYYEFTIHFLIFPNFWLSLLVYTVSQEGEIRETLVLVAIFTGTLFATWVPTTAIIQGSEKIINSTDKEKIKTQDRCRTDIENFLYKYNLQMRLFLLIFTTSIFMKLLEILPNDIRIGAYIFGTIGLSFLLSASAEILVIKKTHEIKLRDGFLDIRTKLLQILTPPHPSVNQFTHCASPAPRQSKNCKEKRIGYQDCQFCRKITTN